MQTLCVVGEESPSVVAAVAERLTTSHDRRVVTINRTDSEIDADTIDSHPQTDGSFRVDADGRWIGTGTERSVTGLLDSVATDYEYALVAGVVHHRLPTVVIGDVEIPPSTEIVDSAPTADDIDIDHLVELIETVEPHITLETLVEQAKASPNAERSGAIATFTGRVRAKDSPDDARTEHLSFEKYEGVAEDRLDAISRELTEREGVFEVLLHHRVGLMKDGEDIVFVVVLAGHREEAFRTVEDGINRLKDEVPIFKKETTTDEEFWLHET